MYFSLTGVVEITVPEGPVKYDSKQTILCQAKEDMKPIEWVLKRSDGKTFDVTTGTDATVIPTSRTTTILLRQATEIDLGRYVLSVILYGVVEDDRTVHRAN